MFVSGSENLNQAKYCSELEYALMRRMAHELKMF